MYVIATAGPKVKEKKMLKGIITAGVNVLRLNFAHGNVSEFTQFIKNAKEIDENILIMIDLCGAKIRVSNELKCIYKIYDGEEVYFCGEDQYKKFDSQYLNEKRTKIIPLNIEQKILLKNEYKSILIKDNTMRFKVLNIENNLIKTFAVRGGIVRAGKGCNIKELVKYNKELRQKDIDAVLWGIKNGADIICHSFTENEEEIQYLRNFIDKNNSQNKKIDVWGKVETMQGVKNIDNITSYSDGIIIGRGDLIPETSLEDTPIYEEAVIKKVVEKNKPIVIATHLLESMQRGTRPTICEAESIYNFIKSGVTGFLLAGETSVGKAPIKTVDFLIMLINKYGV